MKRLFISLAVLLLAACAAQSPQHFATVVGTEADEELFAGVWRGHLDAIDDRLDGPIEFRLERGEPFYAGGAREPRRILWIRLTGRSIAGALEPYYDAGRGTEIYTTFEGTLDNGVIHGRLRERAHLRWNEAGTWTVERSEKTKAR